MCFHVGHLKPRAVACDARNKHCMQCTGSSVVVIVLFCVFFYYYNLLSLILLNMYSFVV